MNIHEHQAKQILKKFGAIVPEGVFGLTVEELLKKCKSLKTEKYVLKAQIHAGGRGKAGGVKILNNLEELEKSAKELLGKKLITHQTGPEGRKVKRLYVEVSSHIEKEFYLSCLVDRATSKIAFISSDQGGMDIEDVASKSPDKISTTKVELKKEILNPLEITEYGLWKDHALNDITFHGIDLAPLDFIKFGQLYAQKGSWEGKQLVNKAFMEQSMQPISEGPGELYGMHTSIRKMSENKRLLVKEGFNGQYLFVIPEENLVAVKFTKYLHNRENGYVISLGPMDYLLWLPFSWLKAIGEAFAGDGESDPEQNDGSINMPATMSVKDKFNCPNTTTDKCPPVQRMQDLVFGLTDLSPSQE